MSNQIPPPPLPPGDKPTFTPGPWRVDASYDIPSVIAHCFPKEAKCVAVVYGDHNDIMARVPGSGGAECIPNANLIAAAPSMYYALRAIKKSCPADPDVTRAFNAAWGLLEAAISKAEGI